MNIDLLSHALAMKLIAAITEEADEAVLKAAMEAFPGIIAEMLAVVVKDGGVTSSPRLTPIRDERGDSS